MAWLVVALLAAGVAGAPAAPTTIPRACSAANTTGFAFCNASLPVAARVRDLIARLTLQEKPFLLTARESPLGGIPRLGIPEYGACKHTNERIKKEGKEG